MAESSQSEMPQCYDSPGVLLTILHFNDVYEIEPRAEDPVGGATRYSKNDSVFCIS